MVQIKSKHGVILSCSLSHENVNNLSGDDELFELAKALEGKRYGFVDDAMVMRKTAGVHTREVWKWLKIKMEF